MLFCLNLWLLGVHFHPHITFLICKHNIVWCLCSINFKTVYSQYHRNKHHFILVILEHLLNKLLASHLFLMEVYSLHLQLLYYLVSMIEFLNRILKPIFVQIQKTKYTSYYQIIFVERILFQILLVVITKSK